MNEIKQREDDRATRPVMIDYIIMVGIVILGYTIYDKLNNTISGVDHKTATITILGTPEFIDGGKGGTDRFEIKTKEHPSKFWISGSSLDVLFNDYNLKQKVENLKTGDPCTVTIRKTDESLLGMPGQRIEVIGLLTKDDSIIELKDVERQNNKSFWIGLVIGILVFTGGTIWKIREKNRPKKL